MKIKNKQKRGDVHLLVGYMIIDEFYYCEADKTSYNQEYITIIL
ncbi:MAG: hypothetical protein JETT_1259 [Candidatus Jettenia ecosi]|uniref:Uncharacterized protein n=1 Tax=Candidatus Jettenia ecosi TaxID=2494326 RepID=A0A533QCF8_9BACT|nr:MAG: hypothetical protein JETT_1259 [Candidatus Jettenia ecosi]